MALGPLLPHGLRNLLENLRGRSEAEDVFDLEVGFKLLLEKGDERGMSQEQKHDFIRKKLELVQDMATAKEVLRFISTLHAEVSARLQLNFTKQGSVVQIADFRELMQKVMLFLSVCGPGLVDKTVTKNKFVLLVNSSKSLLGGNEAGRLQADFIFDMMIEIAACVADDDKINVQGLLECFGVISQALEEAVCHGQLPELEGKLETNDGWARWKEGHPSRERISNLELLVGASGQVGTVKRHDESVSLVEVTKAHECRMLVVPNFCLEEVGESSQLDDEIVSSEAEVCSNGHLLQHCKAAIDSPVMTEAPSRPLESEVGPAAPEAEEQHQRPAHPCQICNQPCHGERHYDWIPVDDKGRRDVHSSANPYDLHVTRWKFYHPKCLQTKWKPHSANHNFKTETSATCLCPHGPCTDWHLRGKCRKGFNCRHCHFHHPELYDKHNLKEGETLHRPQRRERLQALQGTHKDSVDTFLHADTWFKDLAKKLQHPMAVQELICDTIAMVAAQEENMDVLNDIMRLLGNDVELVALIDLILDKVQAAINEVKDVIVLDGVSEEASKYVGKVGERMSHHQDFCKVRLPAIAEEKWLPVTSLGLALQEERGKIVEQARILIIRAGHCVRFPRSSDQAGVQEMLLLLRRQTLEQACKLLIPLG